MKDQTFFISDSLEGRLLPGDLYEDDLEAGELSVSIDSLDKDLKLTLLNYRESPDSVKISFLCSTSEALKIIKSSPGSLRVQHAKEDLVSIEHTTHSFESKSIKLKSPGLYEVSLIFLSQEPN